MIRQKQIELLLLIASQTFFRLIGSSFVSVRKVENKSFPCTHKPGEQTEQVWRENSRRVWTQEKNSGETVHRLGTIIQSIFLCPIRSRQPIDFFAGNSSVRVGTQRLFCPYLKTFVPSFLPTRLTAPGSPRMGEHQLSHTKFLSFAPTWVP